MLLFCNSTFCFTETFSSQPFIAKGVRNEKHVFFGVKPTKETTHAFILRIWIEPRELKDAEPIWRGVVEHVEGDERVYFNNLNMLKRYFAEYLEKIGIGNSDQQR